MPPRSEAQREKERPGYGNAALPDSGRRAQARRPQRACPGKGRGRAHEHARWPAAGSITPRTGAPAGARVPVTSIPMVPDHTYILSTRHDPTETERPSETRKSSPEISAQRSSSASAHPSILLRHPSRSPLNEIAQNVSPVGIARHTSSLIAPPVFGRGPSPDFVIRGKSSRKRAALGL